MSNIEEAAASQKTWADVQKANAAAPAAPVVGQVTDTATAVGSVIAAAEQPDPKPAAAQVTGQTAPMRSTTTTIMAARHAGYLVVDGGSSSTEILACCSSADEAVKWAADRLKTHQFAPLPAA